MWKLAGNILSHWPNSVVIISFLFGYSVWVAGKMKVQSQFAILSEIQHQSTCAKYKITKQKVKWLHFPFIIIFFTYLLHWPECFVEKHECFPAYCQVWAPSCEEGLKWSQILVGYCHMLGATTTLAYCADGTPLLFEDFVAGFMLLYVSLWVACRVPSWTRKQNLESKSEGECSMSTPCSKEVCEWVQQWRLSVSLWRASFSFGENLGCMGILLGHHTIL